MFEDGDLAKLKKQKELSTQKSRNIEYRNRNGTYRNYSVKNNEIGKWKFIEGYKVEGKIVLNINFNMSYSFTSPIP